MTNTIITIGREFGSGGCEIGHKLAEKLGIKCYDKDMLDLAAKMKAEYARRFLKAMMKTNKQLSVFSGNGYIFLWLFIRKLYGYAIKS